jgi:uncharacterized protein involved in type VI secretion and phage assembly
MSQEFEQLVAEVAEHQRSRYYGKYRGKVKTVGDGDNLGKIQVTVPEIYGDDGAIESPWAMPCVPFAGSKHGFVALPEVDDGVWVEFEAGNISRPIWTGFWWADGEMPEPKGVLVRTFITTAGHKLILDDDAGEIHLLHSDGAEMTMTGSEITIKIGQASVTMSDSEISLKVGSSATAPTIKIATTEIEVKASPTAVIKLSSSGVDIANGAVKTM